MNKTIAATAVLSLLLAPAVQADDSDLDKAVRTPEITFRSESDIGLWARFHFATHTPDFERARAFYRMLGFTGGYTGFPLTNTHALARVLGMFDLCQYELVDGEVIIMPDSINTTGIDLLQFKTPFNPDPPYARPNHLGMAYAALLTTNLDADYEYLLARDVKFLSEPYGVPGNQFVFFTDPDGVLFKLVERTPPKPADKDRTQIVGMPYIGINVSDLDASMKFYARFGYTDIRPINEQSGTLAEAQAWGLDRPFRYKGADIAITRGDRHTLRLIQWLEPYDPEPPYPPPINHIGLNRLALTVPDIERAVSILKAQGVRFLSEVAPCCSATPEDDTGIVHAIDPDGIFLELVGGLTPRPVPPQPENCPPLEIKMRQNNSLVGSE